LLGGERTATMRVTARVVAPDAPVPAPKPRVVELCDADGCRLVVVTRR